MLESTEDLVAVFTGLTVLWVILGPLSNGVERGYRSGAGGAIGRGNRARRAVDRRTTR